MPKKVFTSEMDQMILETVLDKVMNNGENIKTVISYLAELFELKYSSVKNRYYFYIKPKINLEQFEEQIMINEANRRYNIHMREKGLL